MLTTTIVDLDAPGAALAVGDRDGARVHYLATPRATAGWGSRRRCRSRSRGSSGPTSCTSSASATRSRRGRPRGRGCAASRTSSSRWACSGRGCARWRSSERSTRRSTAASARRRCCRASAHRARADAVVAAGRPGREGPRARQRLPRAVRRGANDEPRRARHPRGRAGDPLRRPHRGRERASSTSRGGARASGRPLVLAGPDDRHGRRRSSASAAGRSTTTASTCCRPTDGPPLDLYPLADVFVLASAGESFGMVAAEAAAAGTPVVVTDRRGIAGFFRDGDALVVPDERDGDRRRRPQRAPDEQLRARLSAGGVEAARRTSWDAVTDAAGGALPAAVASRTAATRFSTDGS